jgi:hypothetical protein
MRIDINARVMWGDPMEDIRTDWLAKGAPPDTVLGELEAAYGERQRHFRKRGLQDLLMGAGALALGGTYLFWGYSGIRGSVRVSAVMVCLLCAGAFFSVRGIHRLLTGGAAEKSASDLSELD